MWRKKYCRLFKLVFLKESSVLSFSPLSLSLNVLEPKHTASQEEEASGVHLDLADFHGRCDVGEAIAVDSILIPLPHHTCKLLRPGGRPWSSHRVRYIQPRCKRQRHQSSCMRNLLILQSRCTRLLPRMRRMKPAVYESCRPMFMTRMNWKRTSLYRSVLGNLTLPL